MHGAAVDFCAGAAGPEAGGLDDAAARILRGMPHQVLLQDLLRVCMHVAVAPEAPAKFIMTACGSPGCTDRVDGALLYVVEAVGAAARAGGAPEDDVRQACEWATAYNCYAGVVCATSAAATSLRALLFTALALSRDGDEIARAAAVVGCLVDACEAPPGASMSDGVTEAFVGALLDALAVARAAAMRTRSALPGVVRDRIASTAARVIGASTSDAARAAAAACLLELDGAGESACVASACERVGTSLTEAVFGDAMAAIPAHRLLALSLCARLLAKLDVGGRVLSFAIRRGHLVRLATELRTAADAARPGGRALPQAPRGAASREEPLPGEKRVGAPAAGRLFGAPSRRQAGVDASVAAAVAEATACVLAAAACTPRGATALLDSAVGAILCDATAAPGCLARLLCVATSLRCTRPDDERAEETVLALLEHARVSCVAVLRTARAGLNAVPSRDGVGDGAQAVDVATAAAVVEAVSTVAAHTRGIQLLVSCENRTV